MTEDEQRAWILEPMEGQPVRSFDECRADIEEALAEVKDELWGITVIACSTRIGRLTVRWLVWLARVIQRTAPR